VTTPNLDLLVARLDGYGFDSRPSTDVAGTKHTLERPAGKLFVDVKTFTTMDLVQVQILALGSNHAVLASCTVQTFGHDLDLPARKTAVAMLDAVYGGVE
jgi:hypothetical protein